MAQFHNALSNFANLASGRQALAIGAHNLFQNNGTKKLILKKIGPIMMTKRIGYKISTIFLFARVRDKMTKTSIADLIKWDSTSYF